MKNLEFNRTLVINTIIFGICFFGLFVYILMRAYQIGFTHDESLTFTIINGSSFWALTANNHWLNTILSYLSGKLFGYSEFSLRLPNVLIFILYGYFCFLLIIKPAKSIPSAIIPAVFLLFNGYLMEFFSLSRGYGLAMAFFCGSLYYFNESQRNPDDLKKLNFAVFYSLLTIYSNYSFIIPIAALHLAYFFSSWRNINWALFSKRRIITFVVEGILLLPAIANIIILILRKQLYYGGKKNIVQDTFFSVFAETFQVIFIPEQYLIILLIFVAAAIISLLTSTRGNLFFIHCTLLLGVLIPIVLHYLVGMKYPIGRTALYWIVLFGVFIHLFLDTISERKAHYFVFCGVFSLVILMLLSSFSKTANLAYARHWWGDADTLPMLEVLSEEMVTDVKCNLMIDWYYEPAINYYRIVKQYDWLNPVTRKVVDGVEYDFMYFPKKKNIDMRGKTIVKEFDTSGTKLIKISRVNGCCPEH